MFEKTQIEKARRLKETIRHPYAFPGGYPLALLCDDGGTLCVSCARFEFESVLFSTLHNASDGWTIEDSFVNWESNDLHCAHCGQQIESAYGESD